MRRGATWVGWGLWLALAGCATELSVDPDGLLCDDGVRCPAGYFCLEGVCRLESARLCSTCEDPPPDVCVAERSVRAYAQAGACQPDGTCSYPYEDRTCVRECAQGECLDQPCSTESCSAPPAPRCLDGFTLRTYSVNGSCDEGTCLYPRSDRVCAQGCENGRCRDQDLCGDVSCQTPPAPACVDGQVRTYAAPGRCDSGTGTCSYPFSESPCAGECVNNVCVPPARSFSQGSPRVGHAVNAVDVVLAGNLFHALAVGPNGSVSKWDGQRWQALSTPGSSHLRAVWLASSTLGWVVGDGRTLWRYDGTRLTPVVLAGGAADAKLVSVHGSGSAHALVAEEKGGYWRYDGSGWTFGQLPSTSGPLTLRQAFVSPGHAERIVGKCGVPGRGCMAAATGLAGTWFLDEDRAAPAGFQAVGPSLDSSTNSSWVGRADAPALRRHLFSAGEFDDTPPGGFDGGAVAGITGEFGGGAGAKSVYVLTTPTSATARGALYRYSPDGGVEPSLMDVGAVGGPGGVQALSRGDLWGGVLVSDSSDHSATLVRRAPGVSQVLALGDSWRGAALDPEGGLHLVNAGGDVASHYPNLAGWFLRRSPGTGAQQMNALAAGSSLVVTVGEGGWAGVFTPSGVTQVSTGSARTLRAICRVSDLELYAVGDEGTLLAYDGQAFSPRPTATSANLRAVHCAGPGAVYACGAQGTVLKMWGGAVGPVSPPFSQSSDLQTCTLGADGDLYVAGDEVFAKLSAKGWTMLPAVPALQALQWVGSAELYAIARGNEVVRFDGTAWRSLVTAPHPLFGGTTRGARTVFAGAHGVVLEGQ